MTLSVEPSDHEGRLEALRRLLLEHLLLLREAQRELLRCEDPARRRYLEQQIAGIHADIERTNRLYVEALEAAQLSRFEEQIQEQFTTLVTGILARGAGRRIASQPVRADLPPELVARLDMFERRLDTLLSGQDALLSGQAALHTDVRRGFAALYLQLDSVERQTVEAIMVAVRAWRFPTRDMEEWLGEVRQAIDFWREASVVREPLLLPALNDMHAVVESNLEIKSKLELTIPIIPSFLNYQLEVGGETEILLRMIKEKLARRWAALKQRVGRGGGAA